MYDQLECVAALLCAVLVATPAQSQTQAGLVALPIPQGASSLSVLDKQITVDFSKVSLGTALRGIHIASGIPINFDQADVESVAGPVTLHAQTTIARALSTVLRSTGFTYQLLYSGTIVILRTTVRSSADSITPDSTGSIVGTVRDAEDGSPLFEGIVSLDGTTKSAVVGANGHYRLTRLAPGTHTLVARRIGYSQIVQRVIVPPGGTLTVEFSLRASAAALDQVVTTVTGSQQLSSLGNTIATINADSLVPVTPITSFSDVLSARAPGVQVVETGGIIGTSSLVYIRGIGSLGPNGSNQPILYVDGVRVANSVFANTQSDNVLLTGRFDDLVPEEIESIEIVKGPSAATLYGTDAANGVILVTTKRGRVGSPQWSVYAEGGALTVDPDQFSHNYTGWGHTPDDQVITACTLPAVAAGQCTQDSITKFTPMRVPSLTPLGTGNLGRGGVQVSGGNPSVRYYLGGNYSSQVGYYQAPLNDRQLLDSLLGPSGNDGNYRHPNAITKYDGRMTLTAPLGHDGDVTVGAGLLSVTSHVPSLFGFYPYGGSGYRDMYNGWLFGITPLSSADLQTENAQHFTGSVTAHWLPVPWLTTRATAGVDVSDDRFRELIPKALAEYTGATSSATDNRETISLYSIDLGATAKVPVTRHVVLSTSAGVQYHRQDDATLSGTATNLTLGGGFSSGIPTSTSNDANSVVAGVYAEEQISINDRLYATGAVRIDGASSFGSNFRSATYPKVSVSWLVSREPFFPQWSWLSLLRLRSAYGESGTQPNTELTSLNTQTVKVDGTYEPGLTVGSMRNANLQPERQDEFETGLDADLVHDRVHMEFTYYMKRNVNLLQSVLEGSSIGGFGIQENVGTIRNWGYEALMAVRLVATQPLTWDLSLNGSINHNQVVTLNPNFQATYGQFGNLSIVPGYPINSLLDSPYTFADANGDGIIGNNEVTIGSGQHYYGQTVPSVQGTVSTHVGLFGGRVRVGALFDYRGGFVAVNQQLKFPCVFGTAYAAVDIHAPLKEQAACVAYGNYSDIGGLVSDASYVRFRELSVTYVAPAWLARGLRAKECSLTVSARNLALWTRFPGGDPEAGTEIGGGQIASLPPAQYWLARVNISW
jgi:TonB-linked SusC/RagA family outer membrane protein